MARKRLKSSSSLSRKQRSSEKRLALSLSVSRDPEAEAADQLLGGFWRKGDLSFLCRPSAQLDLYKFVHSFEEQDPKDIFPILLRCHRRLGKSYLGILLAVERCLRAPGQRVVFGAPTYEQVRKIVIPNLNILLRTCPVEMRPLQANYQWRFRSPLWAQGEPESILDVVGVNFRNGDPLRGSFADAVFLDEVRDVDNLRYLVEDILLYQFAGRSYPWLVLASTPPRSGDHDFESYFTPRAVRTNRYKCFPVTENRDWTQRDEQMLLTAIGGAKDSISWRREALCEAVSDEDELIVPEFQRIEAQEKGRIVKEVSQRPPRFRPVTCLDTGYTDWNAILFGHIDFQEQKLVVEDERVLHYKSLGEIAQAMLQAESDLWMNADGGWKGGHQPMRMGDLTPQALEDLRTDHKILLLPAEKWDREAAIANLRTGFQRDQIIIHPRCKNLIYQLKNGIWNEKRTQFERTKRLGHCDALAALVYMYRMAPWKGNPFPDDWGVRTGPEWFTEPKHRPLGGEFDAFLKIHGI